MKVISFFNNKGGVGKTTLTCNLASIFANEFGSKVLVIDCDPQCNATMLILGEDSTVPMYWEPFAKDSESINTILDVLKPIENGDSSIITDVAISKSCENRFNVDLLPGHPRLSIIEDQLSQAWRDTGAGNIGGLRQTNWCSYFCDSVKNNYDVVFLDLGPSLGSLNRTCLLGSDYFVTPMGADVFSIIGLRNIGDWLGKWINYYKQGIENCERCNPGKPDEFHLNRDISINHGFAGYTIQSYIAKNTGGVRRPTKAFDNIISTFPTQIQKNLGKFKGTSLTFDNLALGEVPNMYSLVPLAQAVAAPIPYLKYSDGLVGTHFSQAQKYKEILLKVAHSLRRNIGISSGE